MKHPLFFCGWGFKQKFFDELAPFGISWDVIAWSLGIARLLEFLRSNPSVSFGSLLLVACQREFARDYLDAFITAFRADPCKEMLKFYRKVFWKRQRCFERFKKYLYVSAGCDFGWLEGELLELSSCEVDIDLIKKSFKEIVMVIPVYDLIVPLQNMRILADLLGARVVEVPEPHFCFCNERFLSLLKNKA